MSRTTEVKAVNCTACGAGLDVLGGGRVSTHICPYCGSELDATDNYALLKRYTDLPRPSSPFSLGDTVTIQEVRFTIIGTLGMRETWQGRVWTWAEHQLFSPTHGYAFLSWENGHATFSRRVRTDVWLSSKAVERAETRPRIRYGDDLYQYYETSQAEIAYAEGEFTWRPQRGKTSQTVSAKHNETMLEFAASNRENEVYLTTYVDHDTLTAGFDGDLGPAPTSSHPLLPVRPWKDRTFTLKTSALFAALCLVIGLVLGVHSGSRILEQTLQSSQLPIEIPIDIKNADGLTTVTLSTDVQKGWASLDLELTGPKDETIFEVERNSEYYTGIEDGSRWTENKRQATIRFRPAYAGQYTLSITGTEGGHWDGVTTGTTSDVSKVIKRLSVSVRTGGSSGLFAFVLAVVFAGIAGLMFLGMAGDHKRQWAGSDWYDDD